MKQFIIVSYDGKFDTLTSWLQWLQWLQWLLWIGMIALNCNHCFELLCPFSITQLIMKDISKEINLLYDELDVKN